MVGPHKYLMGNATEEVSVLALHVVEGSLFKPEEVWLLVELQGPGTLRAMGTCYQPPGEAGQCWLGEPSTDCLGQSNSR